MGAFCVFGVSRGNCRLTAEKKVPTSVSDEKGKNRSLSQEEWAARRDLLAARLFDEGARPVKVSPEFDAPQFCRDWLAVSPGEVRLARVMGRGPKIDKKGNPVVRGGAPVITWVEYAAAAPDIDSLSYPETDTKAE
jgi:hypothetical protein